jgi:hypothetical protein
VIRVGLRCRPQVHAARFEHPRFAALMRQTLSRPGIRHEFVAGPAERHAAVPLRRSGT